MKKSCENCASKCNLKNIWEKSECLKWKESDPPTPSAHNVDQKSYSLTSALKETPVKELFSEEQKTELYNTFLEKAKENWRS